MTNLPEGSVIITPNEVYREMQDISKKVDALTTLIDPALAELRDKVAGVQTTVTAVDLRVRALENWRWFVLGIAGVIAPAGGFFLSYLFGGGS